MTILVLDLVLSFDNDPPNESSKKWKTSESWKCCFHSNSIYFDNYREWIMLYCYMKHINIINIHFLSEKVDFELIRESENESASIQGLVLYRMKKERKRNN